MTGLAPAGVTDLAAGAIDCAFATARGIIKATAAKVIDRCDMKFEPLVTMQQEVPRPTEVPLRHSVFPRWLLLAIMIVLPAHACAAGRPVDCASGPASAAAANAASLDTIAWSPFRRPEIGWVIYGPQIAATIATSCPPDSPGFAAALARWQAAQRLPATGVLDAPGFTALNARWTANRPFVAATRNGGCPPPPEPAQLATATQPESYIGKTIQLRGDTLAAWRRLVAAAQRDLPGMKSDPRWLTIFSGFRAPLDDDVRCMIDNNCQGVTRATCSAHRTGLAIDAYVGVAPGFGPDSTADANRRVMSQTAVYRWLVRHAREYGFTNYVFEPWHWEWQPPA